MLKKYPLSSFLKYAVAALYSIPATFFIEKEIYSKTWLLFMGNAFFLCIMFWFIIFYKKANDNNTGKLFMLFSGLIVTAMGVIITCVFITLIIVIAKSSFFSVSASNNITHAPVGIPGLAFVLYLNAVAGNVIAGSFASIMTFFGSRTGHKPKRI